MRWIIHQWDEHEEVFWIGDHDLAINQNDIYFFIGFPCRGAWENMTSGRPNPRSALELVRAYCIPKRGLVSNKVPIERIRSRSMRAILWMIVCLARS